MTVKGGLMLSHSKRDLVWRRIADGAWLALFTATGLWFIGWALGVYDWRPSSRFMAGVAFAAGALEFALLANKASRDTLSERIRLMARYRTLIPLGFGIFGGVGLALKDAPELVGPQLAALRGSAILVPLAVLMGHFFRPPRPWEGPPQMDGALWSGAFIGAVAALGGVYSPLPFERAFAVTVLVTYLSFRAGARYFALEDEPKNPRS